MAVKLLPRAGMLAGIMMLAGTMPGSAPPALAQDTVTPRIGIVDMLRIRQESIAAQGVTSEVESKEGAYRAEITARENELRGLQEELERQRTVLSPDAFAARQAEFGQRIEQLQRDVIARNRQLEEILGYGMQRVQVEALKIVADIAETRQLDIVLDKSQVLLVAKDMDFSTEVIERLNATLPAVSTTPPAQ